MYMIMFEELVVKRQLIHQVKPWMNIFYIYVVVYSLDKSRVILFPREWSAFFLDRLLSLLDEEKWESRTYTQCNDNI